MFADRAFGDGVIWGHISQVQSGEGEGLATHRQGEMEQTLPQVAPHSGLILPPSILPPQSALNRLKDSRDRKGRKLQVGILSSPPHGGSCRPPTQARRALWAPGEKTGTGMEVQGAETPNSTTIWPRSSPVTSFFPLPVAHLATSTCPHPVPRSIGSDASFSA